MENELVYLDLNIYNRPFDDQTQVRIRLETIAVFAILQKIQTGEFRLAWSFILDYENSLNPYEETRMEIERFAMLSSTYIGASDPIRVLANSYEVQGVKPRDALHLACAAHCHAAWFVTCDDRLLKKGATLNLPVKMINPLELILGLEEDHESFK